MAAHMCKCPEMLRPISRAVLVGRGVPLSHSHAAVVGTASVRRDFHLCQARHNQRKTFLGQFIDNLRQEMTKNKEMKENLKKFREEAQKLEQSDALKEARRKYEKIEAETAKSSQVLQKGVDQIKDKLYEGFEEIKKSDIGKKSWELGEEVTKRTREAAESVSKQTENISKTAAYRTISKVGESVKEVKEEFDESLASRAKVYRPPKQLRKRKEFHIEDFMEEKPIEANEEATGVVMHKESKFYQQWRDFRDNSPIVNRVFDLKMKYDESDNVVVRASRLITDKVGDLVGGLFSKTEMSEVLTEIIKVDPTFTKEAFLKQCETDIIPNILEAMIRGDLEILKDWCFEAPYNVLATPVKQGKALGCHFDSKVLDIDNLDLATGKVMEQGPVLVISFTAQQIMVVRNAKGDVTEGDPNKVLKVIYVWALCRDQEEFDPRASWKLMDLSASHSTQLL
ncbi:PREDICTED: mitochondrial import inner membrane translocase subunit TIM44-like [Branchiostoma belcheri]|uniref:Mitochondrial import inner membrane translocase subunit TIM44 n=1 Tax=Branchiostoma belcheri TaxID=7741 RepID=A0A6P4YK14_BRABE|nr:PREDICTED: mitochondrial import inner membrane translocase subunit TIM44-like [Branchiostoma belcheri]KAI8481346.1 Mitochondrial import inner membrane translocase subunit TIM44 [Branchiostoma belcheri]KAI8495860.1 Mitochondrial import inner membrane translocase subunit TIM44 [Branchiostoma belcheri]